MESYLLDWANQLLRRAHVITAIAWMDSSFGTPGKCGRYAPST